MKRLFLALGLLSIGSLFFTLTGCSTSQPGATDTLGVYSTNVSAAPDKTTDAANKACKDLKLADILSEGTKIDGKVTARTAQGDAVTINVSQAGENVSTVAIHIGTTGDQAISKQLVDRINSHLSWFGS